MNEDCCEFLSYQYANELREKAIAMSALKLIRI